MLRSLVALPIVLSLMATTAMSATITIRADGTGDYPTIQGGVNAAGPTDEIVLEPGTYNGAGNVDVSVTTADLIIRSSGGRAVTIIDAAGALNGFSVDVSSGDFSLQGVTIARATTGIDVSDVTDLNLNEVTVSRSGGRGIVIGAGQTITLRSVRVEDSGAHGVYAYTLSRLDMTSCDIVGNRNNGLWTAGGGSGPATISSCYFHGNGNPSMSGGAVWIGGYTSIDFHQNTVCHNAANDGAGIYCVPSAVTISNCTFAYNEGDPAFGPIVYLSSSGTITRTIVSHSPSGRAMRSLGASISYCDLWGNAGGDGLGGGVDSGGNINNDPMYCGINGSENYYLTSVSLCSPNNNPDGVLIGAWPEACGTVKTDAKSWGELKAIYR